MALGAASARHRCSKNRRCREPARSRHSGGTRAFRFGRYPRGMSSPSGQRLLRFDRRLGARFVAGADEAGRGSLAGPLVVAGVLFDYEALHGHRTRPLALLNDSKQVEPEIREVLIRIRARGGGSGVGARDPGVRHRSRRTAPLEPQRAPRCSRRPRPARRGVSRRRLQAGAVGACRIARSWTETPGAQQSQLRRSSPR